MSTATRGRFSRRSQGKSQSRPQSISAGAGASIRSPSAVVSVWIHSRSTYRDDILLNPKTFPFVSVGDVVSIVLEQSSVGSGDADSASLYLRVSNVSALKGAVDCSLLASVAAAFNIPTRAHCRISRVDVSSVVAFACELSFIGEYIGRADHFRIHRALAAQCVFSGGTVEVNDVKLKVENISRNNSAVRSAVIAPSTRLTFRSRSARLYFLIQLSSEMYEFADDGELFFEKIVAFLTKLFTQWNTRAVAHQLTIVFFSRTILSLSDDAAAHNANSFDADSDDDDDGGGSSLWSSDEWILDRQRQRHYCDQYEVVVDAECPTIDSSSTVNTDWMAMLRPVKRQFHTYKQRCGWGHSARHYSTALPAQSRDGNILEAINFAVSNYALHFIDRDLLRSGQNIVLLTAGNGVFAVDNALVTLTKQRMVDGGIGCDMICMSRPPLHAVPLFVVDHTYIDDMNAFKKQDGREHSDLIFVPFWISIFYFTKESDADAAQPPRRKEAANNASSIRQSLSRSDGNSAPLPDALVDEEDRDDDAVEFDSRVVDETFVPLSHCNSADFQHNDDEEDGANTNVVRPRYEHITHQVDMDDDDPFTWPSATTNKGTKRAHEYNKVAAPAELSRLQLRASNVRLERRWGHLYRHDKADGADDDTLSPNWRSLCHPAMLPLTTFYRPNNAELNELYVQYFHMIQRPILTEMIACRFASDYQHVVAEADGSDDVMWFIKRNQVHRLEFDTTISSVKVQRYRPRRIVERSMKLKPLPSPYLLYHSPTRRWISLYREFQPAIDDLNWTEADRLVSEDSNRMTDDLKYKRIRFALLPPNKRSLSRRNSLSPSALIDDALNTESYEGRVNALLQSVIKRSIKECRIRYTSQSDEAKDDENDSGADSDDDDETDDASDDERSSSGVVSADADSDVANVDSAVDRILRSDLGFALRQRRARSVKVAIQGDATPSDRSEWFMFAFDRRLSDRRCFHFEVQWIVASGAHISDWVKTCMKRCERLALTVVRIPAYQSALTGDAFHTAILIPTTDDARATKQEIARLQMHTIKFARKHLAFIRDRSYKHGGIERWIYLHSTGLCAIRQMSNGVLFLTNHNPAAQSQSNLVTNTAGATAAPSATALARAVALNVFERLSVYMTDIAHIQRTIQSAIEDAIHILTQMKRINQEISHIQV